MFKSVFYEVLFFSLIQINNQTNTKIPLNLFSCECANLNGKKNAANYSKPRNGKPPDEKKKTPNYNLTLIFFPRILLGILHSHRCRVLCVHLYGNFINWTGFTMYTTCVIWLAFVPLYFGTANHVPLRLTSMSVTISLSASVTVACLFSPKVSSFVFITRQTLNYYSSNK